EAGVVFGHGCGDGGACGVLRSGCGHRCGLDGGAGADPCGGQTVGGYFLHRPAVRIRAGGGRQLEPVETVPGQSEKVGKFADLGEVHSTHALDRVHTDVAGQVQFDRLWRLRQIVDTQHAVVTVFAEERQDAGVGGLEFGEGPGAEHRVALADLDHPAGPVEQ